MAIKISDLSVGDWVLNHRDYPTKVQVITTEGNLFLGELDAKPEHCTHLWVQDIKPVPITAEILENNGFERLLDRDLFYHSESGLEVAFEDGEWEHTINLHEYTIHTISGVHHVQHLLRFYGFDKEINL